MGWLKIEMPWKVFLNSLVNALLLWKPSEWQKNAYTLDEATSNDSACGVLASLNNPNFCICFKIILGSMIPVVSLKYSLPVATVLTGSDRDSLLKHYLSYIFNPEITTGNDFSKGSTLQNSPFTTSSERSKGPHWQNSHVNTGSERSKGSRLTKLLIRYL